MSYISATAEIMYAPLDLRFAVMAVAQSLSSSRQASTKIRVDLKLVEKCHPRVLVIQPGKLPHDLLAALIVQLRNHHFNGNNLIAALPRNPSVFHASFPHPQFLPALRSRRNPQLRPAID